MSVWGGEIEIHKSTNSERTFFFPAVADDAAVVVIDVRIVKYATNFHVQEFFRMNVERTMIYSNSKS